MADGPVIVVGGPGSWPAGYRGLAATLSALSGRKAYVVPLTPLDWVLGRLRGYGQTVFEVASTVDGALLESEDDRALLVGH